MFEDLIWKVGLDMGLAARKQNRLQVELKLRMNSGIVGVWELYLTEDTQLESWMTACLANGGGISFFAEWHMVTWHSEKFCVIVDETT